MYYRLFTSKINSEDGVAHDTYGIKYNGGEIADITFCKEKLAQRVTLFNRLRLEPEHLMDAVYDLMCEANSCC